MITWMQRHKKYLIITIWISTISFVGAGFLGWGQYDYGNKAGAIAKVGDIELTRGELQKEYSRLYSQYNQMFQGNFDEEKAKNFGLKNQALKQLTDRALLLNLASSYDLEVSNAEILAELTTQEYFFKDGVFNKETYKQVLSRNRLGMAEYESDLKKQILISKMLKLLPVEESTNEAKILETVMSIADKISYKVISDENIKIDTSDKYLKPFWEKQQQNFMSEISYNVKYIKQEKIVKTYTDTKISAHYNDNKTHFKGDDGKILPLTDAKDAVISELNDKATKDAALRVYIAYKKNKLDKSITPTAINISASNNIFNAKTLENVSKLSLTSPYMKPVLVNGEYYTIELVKTVPSKAKSFEQAKEEILPIYIANRKKTELLKIATSSIETFKGKESDFITVNDVDKLSDLDKNSANEFLVKLFNTQEKRSFITLNDGKIILYNIMEQKLLTHSSNNQDNSIVRLKSAMFNEGLIKNLQNKYRTEIFIEGL